MQCLTCLEKYGITQQHLCKSNWQTGFTFSTVFSKDMATHKPIDYRKVFALRNVVKYYLWSYKQRLFWWANARGYKFITRRLPNKYGNDVPYPIRKETL